MKLTSLCKNILVPLCLPYSLFIGCSVIGAIAGGASHPAREGRITSTLGLDSIHTGAEVQLLRFDRSTVEGTYRGLALYPGKQYVRLYESHVARSAYRGYVPELNQRILLRSSGMSEQGFFEGIDRGNLLFQPDPGSDTVEVSVEDVEWLQASDSLHLQGKILRKLVRDGSMPGRRVIQIEAGGEMMNVPYESIEIVQLRGEGSGALAGFLIGAAVDLTAVILIVDAEQKSESDCNNSVTSCSNSTCTTTHR
jgi:hypothetical protein